IDAFQDTLYTHTLRTYLGRPWK
uniref:Pectinesterase (Fragments) n=1 Tax=Capsicum chinense TaxID=80379 RepID=PME_CAPCH|nr:RecName: Full=Pectinesterase; Short=PE; AltName: Full=Pectin methylesterase [Capsicum chinense]